MPFFLGRIRLLGLKLNRRYNYEKRLDSASLQKSRIPINDSRRVNETYIEVKGEWKYLYRALDSEGNASDFLLNAKRDAKAAKCFFCSTLTSAHTQDPWLITMDKNAAYPTAIEEMKAEAALSNTCQLWQRKYLNNIIEQDYQRIKR